MKTVLLVAQIYNGLLYPEMQTIADAMTHRGQRVQVLWHDQEDQRRCPPVLIGHSMGGDAALHQAQRCTLAGRPPRVVVTIDPGGRPQDAWCPAKVKCVNFYNPMHPIGGEFVQGAKNIVVKGYTHLQMPTAPYIVRSTLELTK